MEKMTAEKAFELLKIERRFPISKDQIKTAYRTQAKLNHPDVCGNDNQMKLINEANDYLEKHIDGINEYNLKKKKQEESSRLDIAADTFVKAYEQANTRTKKREVLELFLTTANAIKEVEKISMFRDIFNNGGKKP